MERQHTKDDVFLHHAYDAILDHAHQLHMAGYGLRLELINPCTDRKEHFQIAKTRDVVRHVPGQEVSHLFGVDIFTTVVEFQVGELARKDLAEDCSPGSIGIEEKCHRSPLLMSRGKARTEILNDFWHERAPLHSGSLVGTTSICRERK